MTKAKSKRAPAGSNPPPAVPAQPLPQAMPWGYAAIVVVLAVAVYGQAVGFGYTKLDDQFIADKIDLLRDPGNVFTAFRLDGFMQEKGTYFYRPLQTVSFILDAQIAGNARPWAYHLTNVLLHTATSVALLALLGQLGYAPGRALFGSALFAVHPLVAQAVVWIPGRGDLLLGLFGTVAFAGALRFMRPGGARSWGAASAASLALALLAKESGLILLPLLALYFVLVRRTPLWLPRLWFLLGSGALLSAAYLALRHTAMGGLPGTHAFGLALLSANLRVLPEMAAHVVLPVFLGTMPGFSAAATLTGLCCLAIAGVAVACHRQASRPLLLFAGIWIVTLHVPGMMTRILDGMAYDYLNHRSYLPLVGAVVIVLELLPPAAPGLRRWRSALAVALLAGYAGAAVAFSRHFADPWAFFAQAIRTNPHSAQALNNYGSLFLEQGDPVAALYFYDRSLAIRPTYRRALRNRATAQEKLGNVPAAQEAYASLPPVAGILLVQARQQAKAGDFTAAVATCTAGLAAAPQSPLIFEDRALYKLECHDYPGAKADVLAAVSLDPQRPRCRALLAVWPTSK